MEGIANVEDGSKGPFNTQERGENLRVTKQAAFPGDKKAFLRKESDRDFFKYIPL